MGDNRVTLEAHFPPARMLVTAHTVRLPVAILMPHSTDPTAQIITTCHRKMSQIFQAD